MKNKEIVKINEIKKIYKNGNEKNVKEQNISLIMLNLLNPFIVQNMDQIVKKTWRFINSKKNLYQAVSDSFRIRERFIK